MNSQPTKRAWQSGDELPASWVQKVSDFIDNFTVTGAATFFFNGKRAHLDVRGGSGSSQSVPWAITISGSTATIGAGSIKFKGSYYAAGGATVNIHGGTEANPDFILAKFATPSTLTILTDSVSTIPADSLTELYFVLHEVYRSGATRLHKLQRMNSDIITISSLG